MRFLPGSLIAPLLLAATAAGAALPLESLRVALPAQLLHAGKKSALLPRRSLDAGDRISTGRNGRAALQLDSAGQLVLGDDSELYVHSAEPAQGERGALARMVLLRGHLRLDSTAADGRPPQDLRLNAGALRLRVLGSEVWAAVEPGLSETVCLLQGTVEIVSDYGSEQLDAPGDCFRYRANRVRMRLRPDADETLARKLARTAFAADIPPAAAPVVAPAPEPAMPAVAEAPLPLPAAAEPMPLAPVAVAEAPAPMRAPAVPEPAVQSPQPNHWTVVIASVKNAQAAQVEVERLRAKMLEAELRSSNGMNRITIGTYATREQARASSRELQRSQGLKGWLLELK